MFIKVDVKLYYLEKIGLDFLCAFVPEHSSDVQDRCMQGVKVITAVLSSKPTKLIVCLLC